MQSAGEAVFKLHVDTSELDAFVRQWHQATADKPVELEMSACDEEFVMSVGEIVGGPQEQITRLAGCLQEYFPDEIRAGDAVDNAINLLLSLLRARDEITYLSSKLEDRDEKIKNIRQFIRTI